MDAQRLVERMADAPPGIERGAGVLMHVLHGTADAAGLVRLDARDHRAVEADGAGGLAHEAERRAGERGLPAAGFTDQPQRLAGLERERDAVDGAHLGPRLAEECAAAAQHGDDVSSDRIGSAPAIMPRALCAVEDAGDLAAVPSGRAAAGRRCSRRASGQRVWKRQPEGGLSGDGTAPGMPASSLARSGWQASRRRV